MAQKDHYQILEIPYTATSTEIKKAFRRMALLYHPDKNGGSNVTVEYFSAIKKAYDILIDKRKREDYNYFLYTQVNKRQFTFTPISTEEIINKMILLQKNLSASDPFRIDKNSILFELESVFSDYTIHLLQQEKDEKLFIKLVDVTLSCCQLLPLIQIKKIAHQLYSIHPSNKLSKQHIQQFIRKQIFSFLWNKYKIIVAILIAIIFCIGTYYSI